MITLKEMKLKTLRLIEEVNPDSEHLTDDPDIEAKFKDVTNQVMFELVRHKKMPKYVEMEVTAGDLITFEDIAKEVGYEIYQLGNVGGAKHTDKADGTVIKALEDGTLEINCYVFPERITDKTKLNYEIELSDDLIEIMPYGIAADLLKSDISAEYGTIYAQRFADMLAHLDPRYQMPSITIEGGFNF